MHTRSGTRADVSNQPHGESKNVEHSPNGPKLVRKAVAEEDLPTMLAYLCAEKNYKYDEKIPPQPMFPNDWATILNLKASHLCEAICLLLLTTQLLCVKMPT